MLIKQTNEAFHETSIDDEETLLACIMSNKCNIYDRPLFLFNLIIWQYFFCWGDNEIVN